MERRTIIRNISMKAIQTNTSKTHRNTIPYLPKNYDQDCIDKGNANLYSATSRETHQRRYGPKIMKSNRIAEKRQREAEEFMSQVVIQLIQDLIHESLAD